MSGSSSCPAPAAAPAPVAASTGSVGNFDLLSQPTASANTATVPPFQSNPVVGTVAPLQQQQQQQPPLGQSFLPSSKPVQPVPPMQMMNQQQQPQQQLPNMFPGVGMNNGMMMGGGPGVQTVSAAGSTWSNLKGEFKLVKQLP